MAKPKSYDELLSEIALAIEAGDKNDELSWKAELQSNYVVSHTNIVMGLVETIVGLVPAGGGCKELLWRWTQSNQAKNDPDFAPLKVFDIIGYAKTASSPHEAKPLLFLDSNHEVIINRNNLLSSARAFIKNNKDFSPPDQCKFKLSGEQVREKMKKILEDLYDNKKILDQKKVWCAASTHEGEEIFCLKTHLNLKKNYKNIITIIIPRHINRSIKIKKLCDKMNLSAQILNDEELITGLSLTAE